MIYGDNQNIHNHHIQTSFRNSLSSLIQDKNIPNIEQIKLELLDNHILTENTKREIINYCDDTTKHSIYDISYCELLPYIWNRIMKHNNRDDILNILNQEIGDSVCMCFTGRMTRLLNVLVGYYDDIYIQISDSEQITNIIMVLKNRYDGEELKEKVRIELSERNYSKEIIDEWIGYLE